MTNNDYIIAGISKKALTYLDKNNKFLKGKHIGCPKSDGLLLCESRMYKIDYIDKVPVILFEYKLPSGLCKTKIQTIKNKHIFVSLESLEGKDLKWTNKEIKEYLSNL